MEPREWVTLSVALAGLALGILNAVRDYMRHNVRLRVIPKIQYPVGPVDLDRRPRIGFDIINDSNFPVTVHEVGFLNRGTKVRSAMHKPVTPHGEPWPSRLEGLSSITVNSTAEYLEHPSFRQARCAYVTTTTGKTFTGMSESVQQVIETGVVPPYPRRLSHEGLPGFIGVTSFDE
jgi:hypothetical protein